MDDEALRAKQKKAKKYASEPERFTPVFVEMEVKADHGNALVMYSDDEWSCSCDFFNAYRTCSHVMAVGHVLKALPLVQPRGNLEDTSEEFFMKDTNTDLLTVSEVAKILRVDIQQ